MCLCAHILILGRDAINTKSLDPKEYVNRFGGALRKFEYIVLQHTFCAPKNGQNRPFLKIWKSILCAYVCTYLFWGAWRSEQVPLTPKYLWKKTWVLNSNLNPLKNFCYDSPHKKKPFWGMEMKYAHFDRVDLDSFCFRTWSRNGHFSQRTAKV